MSILNIVILACIQGITEFLPVSSSGHIMLAETFLHIKNQSVSFELALNIGTCTSIIIFFYKDILFLIKEFITFVIGKNKTPVLVFQIILSTIPAAVIGVMLMHFHLEDQSRIIPIFAINSIIFGTILYFSDIKSKSTTEFKEVSLKQSIFIGFAQTLALIPGVSRSGICLTASRLSGITKISSIKYCMLISLPITLGGAFVSIAKDIKTNNTFPYGEFLLGMTISFIVGLLFIKILLYFLSKYSFKVFMIYRIILGITLLVIYFKYM